MTKDELIKAAGYIRVSSQQQENGTSLAGQESDIKEFCEKKGWNLIHVYRDVASGEFTEKRASMLRLLADAEERKFDIVVCVNNDRFGRNLKEQKENVEELTELGIHLWWVWENRQYDEWDTLGDDIKGAVSESERKRIIQRTLKARIENARKGIPHQKFNIGFNRQYLKEQGTWQWVNPEVNEIVSSAATDFISGKGIYDIAKEIRGQNIKWFTAPCNNKKKGWMKGEAVYFSPSETYLRRVLKDHCGPQIIETFAAKNFQRIFRKKSEVIIYNTGLRILDDVTIQRIHEKLEKRDKVKRTGGQKNRYLLTGFLRCQKCGQPLHGHTTATGYATYRHSQKRPGVHTEYPYCFQGGLKTAEIENAVMLTVFENTMDKKGFQKAISESIPKNKDIEGLKNTIQKEEIKLLAMKKQLTRLVDLALAGTLTDKTIKEKEDEILEAKLVLEKSLAENKASLRAMESSKGLEQQAERVRLNLKEYFGSKQRLMEMTFDEKRELLGFFFTGKDKDGNNLGIYVEPNQDGSWEYFLYGRIICGLRTMKDTDINYQPPDEEPNDNNPDGKTVKLKRKEASSKFKNSNLQQAAGYKVEFISLFSLDGRGLR